MLGQIISHYRITEKLGEGGMGVVYRAEDTKLRRPVALKFLTQQLLDSEEHRDRFLREAQAAAALDLFFEALAFHEGHGQEGLPFSFVDFVDGADVGVIECRGSLGFA